MSLITPNRFPRLVVEGWEFFWPLVSPRVADLVRRLTGDPGPLCAALMRYPQTKIHGDSRPANLGIVREPAPKTVLLDWQLVGVSVPGVDLAWYLDVAGIQLPVSRETTIDWYRDALAQRLGERFDDGWWRPQLELSLLGQLMRMGWYRAWYVERHENAAVRAWAREQLDWFADRAIEAERWLE